MVEVAAGAVGVVLVGGTAEVIDVAVVNMRADIDMLMLPRCAAESDSWSITTIRGSKSRRFSQSTTWK